MDTIHKEEDIRRIAYRLWEQEGRPTGKALEHYFRAEAIWLREHPAVQPAPARSVSAALEAAGAPSKKARRR